VPAAVGWADENAAADELLLDEDGRVTILWAVLRGGADDVTGDDDDGERRKRRWLWREISRREEFIMMGFDGDGGRWKRRRRRDYSPIIQQRMQLLPVVDASFVLDHNVGRDHP